VKTSIFKEVELGIDAENSALILANLLGENIAILSILAKVPN
jgi:hypothetical protein